MDIIKTSFISFFTTLFCIWLLKPVACQIGLVDRPGGRKEHTDDVPLIGGIAIFFGFCFSLLTLQVSLQSYRGLVAGGGLLVLMGVLDDFKGISPKLRLFGQLIAALLLTAWGHHLIDHMGNIFFVGDVKLFLWALPFTLVAVVGYFNAMNMIDGQDGLAGCVALGQVISLLFLSIYLNFYAEISILLTLLVSLIVFLFFNMRTFWRRKASVFLGDAGSTFIAFLIAWFAVKLSQANANVVKPITVLWILAFPIFDLINVFIHRSVNGKSPFAPGRDHFHHILHMYGLDTSLSTWLLATSSFLLGVIGITLNFLHIHEGVQLILFLSLFSCYFFLVRIVRDK